MPSSILLLTGIALTIWTVELIGATMWAPVSGLANALCTLTPIGSVLRRRRGRPRKFAAPSRAVTVTLPESVLESLSKINRDISRAIVNLTTRRSRKNGQLPTELSLFGRRAVITIQPSPSLERRAGIELVPLPDGRALIAFDHPMSVAELELIVFDALEDPQLSPGDRRVFEGIGRILREARRSGDVTLLQRNIVVIEHTSGMRRARRLLTASR